MVEEENFNEISESERISLKFNEMLDCINDDTDNTSTFSDVNFEEIENFEKEIKEQEICNEMDEIIDHLEQQNFMPCVIIDFIEGKFQRCKGTGKLRQLRNLFGTWQVDRDAVKEVDGVLSKLGVCDSHFQFDNKYLHQSLSKNQKGFNEGIIQWRRCISCKKYVTFFSRGVGCVIHTWYLNKKNIQVPCIGQYKCKALHSYQNLCNRAYENIKSLQSICCLCYEDLGGHIHRRSGIRGKSATTCITEKLHDDDITKGLEFIGNLLIKIAQMENNNEFGRTFGQKLWNSRLNINSKKSAMESPQTLQEYYDAFPEFLNDFFYGMVDEIYQKRMKICNIKRKKNNKLPKITIPEETIKIVTFITSILLNLAFPHLKVWLPRILASFSRMPRLLGYFRQLLRVFHLTSHTDRYERQLAKIRMNTTDPSKRLIKGNNIWNLAIIDNIDFKERTFKFGNIYDVTRGSSHATLRMAFQIQLPIEVKTGPEQVVELTAETSLFGMNQGIENTLTIFQQIIHELLNFKKINEEFTYNTNFNAETIKREILNRLDYGSCGESPNIVILEPGSNPNSDEEILHVAEMYKKDFAMESDSFLDIVADEAIFRRLIKCREKWPYIRPLLGQWHTSKDFCSVLLVLFSSYGLLSLASHLGVRFLDKFESAIDYRSTARVLDLIWAAVGIAINIYITKKKLLFSEIMNDEENDHICLKIWYLYYKWTGIWKAHRIGMRVGNFGLQRDSLSAAGPLYASAAKSNYTTAIAHFLATIAAHPQLEKKLNYCSAFKIPHDIDSGLHHVCFGFDEALETFGVRFIKGNISGNIIDEKNLKDQIKASQSERERIDLLMSEYLNDNSISHSERAVNSRQESLWELVNDLIVIFGMDDPLSHQLFQKYTPTEIHQEGLDRLIACYPNGLERIEGIYRQEVLKIESRNTKGRRAVGVVRTKVKDYNNQKKSRNQPVTMPTQPSQDEILNEQSTDNLPDTTKPQSKQKKHRTTKEEMEILSVLKVYKDKLPDDAIASVCEQLSEIWTKKKIKDWWNYHKDK
ncbi:hypothetical protein GLOIN_2v1482460 [Rhizophagus clarus]|uniref:Uncharacterized protein n=1 Tax=Rhizophagus clarus TaxID=94130 RepID=A0A8H3R114_9GLOM|nr:hypothetical protein GLOIN_2v1482460 [Rhizophagus clarus]